MIRLLRNIEIQRAVGLKIILSIIACAAGFYIDIWAGTIILALSVLLILIDHISSYRRYKKIADLAENIDKLLHGDHSISFENYSEGELAILHSEIYKMTVRLREQQQNLMKDRVYLANSLADISHQIRTPLTSINLLVELLSEPNIDDERRYQLIHELYGLLSRIDWLINSLLKISKLDAGTVQFKKERIGLEALIISSCEALIIPIELRQQKISINAAGNFIGDIAWTREAIGNIVKNCMEHTPEGGKIEINANENTLYTEIIIKDNGPGIDKEDMPYIFERFYKGKNSGDKSFGIGLSLSRMIISGQNGTVKAENHIPSGAMFCIRFYKGTV